jgi:hypothetical protein
VARRERKKVYKSRRTCATMDEHRRLAQLYPEHRRRRREIELETREFIGSLRRAMCTWATNRLQRNQLSER